MWIAFTSGEPSGIGPDIAIIYVLQSRHEHILVYGDTCVLINRATLLKFPISLKELKTSKEKELSLKPIKINQQ